MQSFEIKEIDSHLAQEISRTYTHLNHGWPSNANKKDFVHWNYLIKEIKPPYLYDLRVMPEWTDLLEEAYNQIGLDWGIQRVYINGYTYGTDAASHTDKGKMFDSVPMKTAVIYLNDEWNLDWGGETALFDEDEIIYSVLPKLGRVLLFDSDILHAARPLSRNFHGLRKILAFKYFDKSHTTPFLEYLYNLTEGQEHTGRTFLHHLFGVADVASYYKFDKDVIKACYFHSIYGTEFYEFNKDITREDIKKQIGDKAESLVHEFCTMTDRINTILKSDNKQLKQIEFANLIEQNTNGKNNQIIEQLEHQIFDTK